jgi:hypothetical protein
MLSTFHPSAHKDYCTANSKNNIAAVASFLIIAANLNLPVAK